MGSVRKPDQSENRNIDPNTKGKNYAENDSQICEYIRLKCYLYVKETNEMVVTFDKEYLKELYEFGKANDKKHRFQLDIVRRYKRCIDIMIGVPDITLLCKYNGLSFEKLSGDKKDFCSVSVNNQYRIEFTIAEVQGEVMTTICNIIELSNHYK